LHWLLDVTFQEDQCRIRKGHADANFSILHRTALSMLKNESTLKVSCVEQGRWRHTSKFFGSSGSHSPSKLRRALKSSVSLSVKEKRGHRSDQGAVWKEVACLNKTHGVDSDTAAMSDAFETHQDRIASFRESLKYVDGASGVAVAIGKKIVALDLFDKPSTCQKVWDRMLSGAVFDAMEAGETNQHASIADVEQLVAATGDLPWDQSNAVGEGDEFRAESKRGDHASALAFEETVVHGSVVASV